MKDSDIPEQNIGPTSKTQDSTEAAASPSRLLPNSYKKLVLMLRRANIIRDHRVNNEITSLYTGGCCEKVIRSSFRGEDFVQWMVQKNKIKRSEALKIGQLMVERHFRQYDDERNFDANSYYQLKECAQCETLNSAFLGGKCSAISVSEYNDMLCSIIRPIFRKVFSDDKKCVYYELLDEDADFENYLNLISKGNAIDFVNSTPEEKLALFINVYNMMQLHVVYKYGAPLTIWKKKWNQNSVFNRIGPHLFSLQSILNGILRGNRCGIDMLWEPFGQVDPRRTVMIENGEPLVHFAVNTTEKSTPPLREYNTQSVYAELRSNARQCLLKSNDYLRIDHNAADNVYNIQLSKPVFKRYASDFDNKVIRWIISILPDNAEKKKRLTKAYYERNYTLSYLANDSSYNMIAGKNNF